MDIRKKINCDAACRGIFSSRDSGIRTILLGAAVLILLGAGVSGCQLPAFLTGGGSSATKTPTDSIPSGTVNIYLQDYAFHPERITVKAGTKVTWINRDPVFHSVTSETGLFRSGLLAVGQAFTFTFEQPGTYRYYCEKSGGPNGEGMSGMITVVK
ncbi:MAG: cupredoxin domain-containing protein [Anaerolineales bacterium]|nr:cupredoxin domain-containing protein [Anaerolineales bacterium]